MATCKDCFHFDACKSWDVSGEVSKGNFKTDQNCPLFNNRARFVELPFEQNKGASLFDKIAHTTYTLATESHRVAGFTIEGYYLMYNEDRLYTLEKGGIVILAQGTSPYDVVEKAKQAIEKLSKERENNAR